MRFYKWRAVLEETVGTTPKPVVGRLAIVRSGLRALPWSVCRVVETRTGHNLENIVDLRTFRACKEWVSKNDS